MLHLNKKSIVRVKKTLKHIFAVLLYSTALLFILITGYVLFIRISNFTVFSSFSPRNVITTNISNLRENRLALLAFLKLDTQDKHFVENKELLWEKIKQTNTSGAVIAAKKDFCCHKLKEEASHIYLKQAKYFDTQEKLHNVISDIYLFDPEYNLSNTSKALLIEELTKAENGLNSIKKNLIIYADEYSKPADDILNELELVLQTLNESLSTLNEETEGELYNIDRLISAYKNLKESTYEYERQSMLDDEMLDLITQQSNLILEYGR